MCAVVKFLGLVTQVARRRAERPGLRERTRARRFRDRARILHPLFDPTEGYGGGCDDLVWLVCARPRPDWKRFRRLGHFAAAHIVVTTITCYVIVVTRLNIGPPPQNRQPLMYDL